MPTDARSKNLVVKLRQRIETTPAEQQHLLTIHGRV
jgi:hypothetical protein